MSVPFDAKIAPAESVMTRGVGGELVLLNLETEFYFGLDAVGATMWQAICDAGTLVGALAVLKEIYDVDPEQLSDDLHELAEQLVNQKLLEIRGA